ncbi:Holliday junction resolvase RuvX [Patescibacteria group bacterium]
MQILAIDYGKAKTGLALGNTETCLSEPLVVFEQGDIEKLSKQIAVIAIEHKVDKIVIGISGGRNDIGAKNLAKSLSANYEIVYWDEKFSTREAQEKSIEAGIRKGRRKKMEDAYAASVILENYLESL